MESTGHEHSYSCEISSKTKFKNINFLCGYADLCEYTKATEFYTLCLYKSYLNKFVIKKQKLGMQTCDFCDSVPHCHILSKHLIGLSELGPSSCMERRGQCHASLHLYQSVYQIPQNQWLPCHGDKITGCHLSHLWPSGHTSSLDIIRKDATFWARNRGHLAGPQSLTLT